MEPTPEKNQHTIDQFLRPRPLDVSDDDDDEVQVLAANVASNAARAGRPVQMVV